VTEGRDGSRSSFEELEGFLDEVCCVHLKDSKELPIVIVGSKSDIPDDLKEVSKEEATQLAESNGCPLVGKLAPCLVHPSLYLHIAKKRGRTSEHLLLPALM